ncbi:hypothetical protein EB796_000058 [Bugula neritina]|uniref:Uncharacterized protein n=1 Tax=Bugula neritina TaxID=10212 RepID=A0A7J7KTU6_BUGNE|nr:hypothetical protein EB796_000058 [Bugula neritina]
MEWRFIEANICTFRAALKFESLLEGLPTLFIGPKTEDFLRFEELLKETVRNSTAAAASSINSIQSYIDSVDRHTADSIQKLQLFTIHNSICYNKTMTIINDFLCWLLLYVTNSIS